MATLFDYLDCRFKLANQSVVRFDLAVDFTAIGDQSIAFHRLSDVPFVDRRLFAKTSGSMTAVVDMSVGAIDFIKVLVCDLRPILTPYHKLLIAVPSRGNRILPSELGTFRIFIGSLKAESFRF